MTRRVASCACGQLHLTTSGEPIRVSICSCTQCQKRTGSVCGIGAYFQRESIEAIEGKQRSSPALLMQADGGPLASARIAARLAKAKW
jgi:hypothetical protein